MSEGLPDFLSSMANLKGSAKKDLLSDDFEDIGNGAYKKKLMLFGLNCEIIICFDENEKDEPFISMYLESSESVDREEWAAAFSALNKEFRLTGDMKYTYNGEPEYFRSSSSFSIQKYNEKILDGKTSAAAFQYIATDKGSIYFNIDSFTATKWDSSFSIELFLM